MANSDLQLCIIHKELQSSALFKINNTPCPYCPNFLYQWEMYQTKKTRYRENTASMLL